MPLSQLHACTYGQQVKQQSDERGQDGLAGQACSIARVPRRRRSQAIGSADAAAEVVVIERLPQLRARSGQGRTAL